MQSLFKYLFFCLSFSLLNLSAHSTKTDSIQNVLEQCKRIMESNPDSAYKILNNILSTSNLTNKDHFYPYLLLQLGDYHRVSGNYDSSYVKYFAALNEFEKRKDQNLIAEVELNIGILYDLQRDPKSAIKKYKEALINYTLVNDTTGIIKAYMNLGISYKNIGLSSSSNSILDSAFFYYNKADFFLDKVKHPLGLTKLYINIGNLKYTQQHYVEAVFYYKKALKIAEPNNYNHELALILDNLGWAYQELNENNIALNYALDGLKIGRKINSKYNVVNSLSNISRIYEKLKNYKEANKYLNQLIMANDSLINENTIELQNKLQSKYESEKKDNEIILLNTQKEKNAALALAEQKKKNIIITTITFGLILVLVFSFFLYKRFRITHRQKNIIDQKNKDITDSINYAKRIQTALLKEEEHVSSNVPTHFIFFQPKDIVSGDFYWTSQKQDVLYLAVADCTGHGVPGAFLTMLGIAFLNEITSQEKILSPSEILDELRGKFISELNQTGKEGVNKDGMDISIIKLNLTNNQLEWAGANNPLWVVTSQKSLIAKYKRERDVSNKDKTLIAIAPNKQPIGFFHKMSSFINHTIQLEKNDTIYLFSDGYADQFGGEKGKKFMYLPFKKLILENENKSLEEQKEILKSSFNNWKGEMDQLDDVCVIGVRI
tara:strand:+ start:817 stop:2802 length:1986 start_codon:yes stop_codon:yes gene_type:complete